MRPGQNLQHLVEIVERATNNSPSVHIESPKRMRDKDTGRPREHDVVLTYTPGHHTMMVALECRDRSRRIGVPEVEAFKNKRDRTGVNLGIMVSSIGFTRTALKKAEAMHIGCYGLQEMEAFDWCQIPGIKQRVREIIEGPAFKVFPAAPLSEHPVLYNDDGNPLDANALNNIANDCLNNRSPDVAQRQDAVAVDTPVGCCFIHAAPSTWHLLDPKGNRVPLTRLEILFRYRVRCSLIPISFHQYIDHGSGKLLYSAAFASIDAGNIRGDLVMRRGEDQHVEIILVPSKRRAEGAARSAL